MLSFERNVKSAADNVYSPNCLEPLKKLSQGKLILPTPIILIFPETALSILTEVLNLNSIRL